MATISIYQLINSINTGVCRTWNIQGRAEWRTSKKSFPLNGITYFYSNIFLSLKTLYLKSVFLSKLLSQCKHWTGPSIKKSEKYQLSEYLTKSPISLLNQLKNQQFMTCYSSVEFILPNNINKYLSEMKN